MVEISAAEALGLRLRAQHLDRPLGPEGLCEAAGACGFQNTPPGAWELAALCRVEGLGVRELRAALEEEKTLLQAWSLRGAPYVFPTAEAGVFLSPLAALPGEEPWVYTQGITAALDCLGLGFYELLPAVMEAARLLERRSVLSKEELDRVLAEAAEPLIPPEKLPLWRGGTMYGDPESSRSAEPSYPSCSGPALLRGSWCSAGGRVRARNLSPPSSGWAGGLRPRRTLAPG